MTAARLSEALLARAIRATREHGGVVEITDPKTGLRVVVRAKIAQRRKEKE